MFNNIKKIRDDLELTQREMADIMGVSKSSFNYYETGEHFIPLKRLNDFCNIFGVSMDFASGLTNVYIKVDKKYELDREIIKTRFKQVRLDNNVTQVELAKLLNTCQSNISSYESGNTLILTVFIYNFARHFNVSLDYLTGRSDNPEIIKKKKK